MSKLTFPKRNNLNIDIVKKEFTKIFIRLTSKSIGNSWKDHYKKKMK